GSTSSPNAPWSPSLARFTSSFSSARAGRAAVTVTTLARPARACRAGASVGERRVRPVQPGRPSPGFLPVFLPAQRGQVKQRVGAAEAVGAARVGRVGVEDVVAVAQEAAEAGHLCRGGVAADDLRLGPEVVLQLRSRPVQGGLEVVVEVAAV